MTNHVQVALVVVALLYLSGGLFMLLAPESAQTLLSTAPRDPVASALLTAALFAFATIFLLAAHEATRALTHVAVVGLLFLGLTWAYQMFIAQSLPRGTVTVTALIINLVVAVYLLIAQSDAVARLETASAVPAARRGKARSTSRPRR